MKTRAPAGTLRERVTIYRLEGNVNEYGNKSEEWELKGTRPAMITERRGQERMDGGALNDPSSAVVRLRHDALTKTLTPADYLDFRGDQWAVRSVIQVTDRERWVEALAERGVAV